MRSAPSGDPAAADALLQAVLGGYAKSGSSASRAHDLALRWLYRLWVAHARVTVSSADKAAASAHIHAPLVSPHASSNPVLAPPANHASPLLNCGQHSEACSSLIYCVILGVKHPLISGLRACSICPRLQRHGHTLLCHLIPTQFKTAYILYNPAAQL